MKKVGITINGIDYPVKFGYGAIRLLGDIWQLNGFIEVVEKVSGLIPEKGDMELSFETLDCVGDIIWAGIANAAKEDEAEKVSRSDAVDAFFNDVESVKQIFELFMTSMPKGKDGGKQKAPAKGRSKKTS
ncbi:MAG: hypothetical protein AAF039_15995 [Bacteroidota bacterium]